MRKKGIPEVIGESSLNEGVKTRVRVGLELSEEFEVKVGEIGRASCRERV